MKSVAPTRSTDSSHGLDMATASVVQVSNRTLAIEALKLSCGYISRRRGSDIHGVGTHCIGMTGATLSGRAELVLRIMA